MPGPFSSAPLVPLPSAAAGIPTTPNIPGAMAGAFANLRNQAWEHEQHKEQMELAKLTNKQKEMQVEKETQDRAMQKLNLYYRMISGDATGTKAHDQAMIKAVNDAAKEAGLGPMTITDPQTGAMVIDVKALQHVMASKLTSDLSPEQFNMAAQATVENRPGILTGEGVDVNTVDPAFLKMQPYMTSAQREKVIQDFGKSLSQMATGTMTVQALNGELALHSKELASAGVTVADLQNYINSDAFKQGVLAPMAEAKMREMEAMGISATARAAYLKQKTVDEPRDLASKIEYRNGSLQIREARLALDKDLGYQKLAQSSLRLAQNAEKISAYVKSVNNNIQSGARGQNLAALKVSVSVLEAKLKPLMDEQARLTSTANSFVANSRGHDIPQEILDQQKAVQAKIDEAQAALDNASAAVKQGGNIHLSRITGKSSVLSEDLPAQRTVKGTTYYLHSDNKYYTTPEE